jgi:hypothetical protein
MRFSGANESMIAIVASPPECRNVEFETMGAAGQRVWRLRKLHQYVDAELRDNATSGVDLQFFYNGECAYTRNWPTHALALAEAADKRAELEREGWMFHW